MAVASVMAALLKHLKDDVPTSTLTAGRISAELLGTNNDPLHPKWPMPTNCIILKLLGGPPPDRFVRQQMQRVQLDCYGARGYLADEVWRTAHHALVPAQGKLAFTASHCTIYDIRQESGMVALPDYNGAWPRTIVAYVVRYAEVALA